MILGRTLSTHVAVLVVALAAKVELLATIRADAKMTAIHSAVIAMVNLSFCH